MVYFDELQRQTVELVDKLINENKTFDEIETFLLDNGYSFSRKSKNGYFSKKRFSIEKITRYMKDGQNFIKYDSTLVDLIKRRNGLATWETIGFF